MTDGLDPEDLDGIRRFLAAYDAGEAAVPPGNECAVAELVALARLLLSGAAVETLDGRLRLRQTIAAIGALPPWFEGPPAILREFEKQGKRTPVEQRHGRAVDAGRRGAVGWLCFPATRDEIETARPELNEAAAPLWVYSQTSLAQVIARLLDTTAFYPDGTTWPDPLASATPQFRARFEAVREPYLKTLQDLADRIHAAGAPMDPHDLGVLLVLAQLVHLPIDWSREPTAILDELIVWPPGWIDLEAAKQGHLAIQLSRHGRTSQVTRDLAEASEAIVKRIGPDRIAAPYAGGRRRKRPETEHRMKARQKAVAGVFKSFRDVTAGELRRTWSDGPDTPGGMLRTRLGAQPQDRAPAESTLRSDILAAEQAAGNPQTRRPSTPKSPT